MKTTEIFVEQALIGFLVLLAFALPYTPEISNYLLSVPTAASHQGAATDSGGTGTNELLNTLGVGFVLVGAAYLIGLLFDRYADEITQPLERHIRTLVVIKAEKKTNLTSDRADPFPEDDYRTHMLHAAGAAADWFGYLRSAIRLCRAMAILLPGITLGAILGCYGDQFDWPAPAPFTHRSFWGPGILVAAYLILPILGSIVPLAVDWRPPRTDSCDWKYYKIKRDWVGKPNAQWPVILGRAVTWIDVVLLLVALLCACAAPEPTSKLRPHTLLIWLAGMTLTILALWVWWRVTETYMGYLKRYADLTRGPVRNNNR